VINDSVGDSFPFGFALARFSQGCGYLLQGNGACPELVEGLGMTTHRFVWAGLQSGYGGSASPKTVANNGGGAALI
jgi:hypothetical protein